MKLMKFSSVQSPAPGKAVFGSDPAWPCLAGGSSTGKVLGPGGNKQRGAHSTLAALSETASASA